MLFIIVGHICSKHKGDMELSSSEYIIDMIIMPFVSVAVNTFILISGYWGIKFKIQRLLKLNLQTWFYSLLIFTATSFLLGWHYFSPIKDIGVFIPVFSKQYWFITAYFALYLLSPILNRFVASLSKTHYKLILLLGFFLFYLWPTGSFLINTGQLVDDAGYGIVNFSYLYLLGRYIRLYNLGVRHKATYYLLGYCVCGILCFIIQYFLSILLGFEFSSWWSYNTVFILGGATCLFLYFSRLNFQSEVINKLAKSCLAVYLIHMGPYLWINLGEEIQLKNYFGWEYVSLVILSPIAIYLFSFLIENIRNLIFCKVEDFIITRICKNKLFFRFQCLMDSLNLK